MRRNDWIKLCCGLALAALMTGANDCESSPPPDLPTKRFCAGESRGVLNDLVRDLEGEWNAILGGFEADDYYATVQVVANGQGYCTGTVITPHAVLTAGHCAGDNGYRVYQDRIKHPTEYYVPSKTVLHPGYYRWSNQRGQPHDDLLLLFFDDELPIAPVAGLYDSETQWGNCEETFGQGWGQFERPDAPPPPGYEYIPCEDGQPQCLQQSPLYIETKRATDIDTKVPGWGGICFGDSGGPLYAKMSDGTLRLAGVTSTTSAANCVGYDRGDGFKQAYGTHVRTGYYLDWVDAELRSFYAAKGLAM